MNLKQLLIIMLIVAIILTACCVAGSLFCLVTGQGLNGVIFAAVAFIFGNIAWFLYTESKLNELQLFTDIGDIDDY